MDISKMLQIRPPRGGIQDSTLQKLTEDAGRREETWKRMEGVWPREWYTCARSKLDDSIVDAFRKAYGRAVHEWATSHNLSIVHIRAQGPVLFKKGLTTTSLTASGGFAVVIPYPSRDCEVQYIPNKYDPTMHKHIDWLNPVLLPKNAMLVLLNGEIKFQLVIFGCKDAGARDQGSMVDGTDNVTPGFSRDRNSEDLGKKMTPCKMCGGTGKNGGFDCGPCDGTGKE